MKLVFLFFVLGLQVQKCINNNYVLSIKYHSYLMHYFIKLYWPIVLS